MIRKVARPPGIGTADMTFRASDTSLGEMRTAFLGWGVFNVCVYLVFFLVPYGYGGWFITFLRVSQLLWILMVPPFAKVPFRLNFPSAVVAVLQVWSILTMFYAWNTLGRPTRIGRSELFLWEGLLLFMQVAALCYIDPKLRGYIRTGILVAFSISCLVGLMQFLRFPPALAMSKWYTYKSIDNWDGTVGVRAIGLTFHPRELAFEAVVCFALVGCMAYGRRLYKWELAALILYSGVLLFTQARGFYPVLIVMWLVVGIPMLRTDFKRISTIIGIGVALLMIAVTVAPNRFGYMRQSTSLQQDTSYKFRQEGPWMQVGRIYENLPWTGIGPDSLLFLGQGDRDAKWGTYSIMESAYRVFLCMYGLPGLFLLIFGMAGTIVIGGIVAFNTRESPMRRSLAAAGIIVIAGMAFNGHSTNTFDGYMQFPVAMMLAGLAMRTREEESARQRQLHGATAMASATA